jgi:hypothetical protein
MNYLSGHVMLFEKLDISSELRYLVDLKCELYRWQLICIPSRARTSSTVCTDNVSMPFKELLWITLILLLIIKCMIRSKSLQLISHC